MSWRERDYGRYGGGGRGAGRALLGLLNGSVPLGEWFGVRVRVHASLIIFIALTLLFDYSQGYTLKHRLVSMGVLFALVLIHEFGHCFAARWLGGSADDILMWPLGGLAMATPPQRPWPTFLTVAAGPFTNLLICALMAGMLWVRTGRLVSLNPFHPLPPIEFYLTDAAFYLWWIFSISYMLMLFNLLPVFPLDGGQMTQALLWSKLGYYSSMRIACITGIVGAIIMCLYALMTGQWLLLFIGISGLSVCSQKLAMLKEMGPELFAEGFGEFAAAREDDGWRRRRLSRRKAKQAQRRSQRDRALQARIDAILDKVHARGMHSLTWWERRALRKATERQRQRERELSRSGRV